MLRRVGSNLLLQGVGNGTLKWTTDPARAVRSLQIETARRNLKTLERIYRVPAVTIEAVALTADPRRPGFWIAADD